MKPETSWKYWKSPAPSTWRLIVKTITTRMTRAPSAIRARRAPKVRARARIDAQCVMGPLRQKPLVRSDPGMNARATRFPLFDSLRAIAAISVLAFHAGIVSGLLSSGSWLKPYAARLDVGVSVFFLISGFLLYRPFTRARLLGESQPQTGAYAWRRFLRIVPAYWVALTIITICLGLPRVFSAAGIPIYYGFGQI